MSLVIVNKHLISILGFREGASPRRARARAGPEGVPPKLDGFLDFWKFLQSGATDDEETRRDGHRSDIFDGDAHGAHGVGASCGGEDGIL